MSTLGTWRRTYPNKGTQVTATYKQELQIPWNQTTSPQGSRTPALPLMDLCWHLCACRMDHFCSFHQPWAPDEGNAQFPQERKRLLSVSKWWLGLQRTTYHFVMAVVSPLDGGRKPGNCGEREQATGLQNRSVKWCWGPESCCTDRDLLQWLSCWSCQLTSWICREEEAFFSSK